MPPTDSVKEPKENQSSDPDQRKSSTSLILPSFVRWTPEEMGVVPFTLAL